MLPLISIIIPVYNLKPYLRDCLNSILNQNYKNFEVIIIDDGSTDDSISICNYYVKNYPNFSCVRQENKGVSLARKLGVSLSKGVYITFVDGDDTLPHNALDKLYSQLIFDNLDIVICAYNKINKRKINNLFLNKTTGVYNSNEYLKILLLGQCIDGPCGKLFKRELFNTSDFVFPKGLTNNEDFIMNFILGMAANKVLITNDITYNYHYRPNSASSHYMNIDKWIELFSIIEKLIYNRVFLYNDFIHFKLHRLKGIYLNNKQINEVHKNLFDQVVNQASKLTDLNSSEKDTLFLLKNYNLKTIIVFFLKVKRRVYKILNINY